MIDEMWLGKATIFTRIKKKNITTALFLVHANTGGFEKGVEVFTALTQVFETFDRNSTLQFDNP